MWTENLLSGKRIVIGVSGGIAAYKSIELMRLIQKAGGEVRVVMTRNALSFVGKTTFAAISGSPVFDSMFDDDEAFEMWHINWAKEADAVVVAPATANIIGKMAAGIADDPLSTFLLAVTAPRLVCPAMNVHMYENRAVQRNIDVLESDGYIVVDPDEGELACKDTGPGRLADPEVILERLAGVFAPKDLAGRRVLVSAGPTREFIDPVRYISNPSSGKMGFAVARAAALRGASVSLVSGPSALPDISGVTVLRVVSAAEMAEAVFMHSGDADIVIKTAAVSDYRPAGTSQHKIKKGKDAITLEMEKTTDILAELGRRKRPGQILVGFAAETRDLEKYAMEKLERKNLDMIAANIVGGKNSGFDVDTNAMRLFFPGGGAETLPVMDKFAVANILIDRILERIGAGR